MRGKTILAALVLLLPAERLHAAKLDIGLEQDVLPYLTGGYYAGVWAGRQHLRGRLVTAHVDVPDAFVASGFTNKVVTAYAAVVDYFPRGSWAGPWAGAGLVYWKSSVQSDARLSTAHFENYMLNGSVGYVWMFHDHFYVTPWAGMHLRVGGDTEVDVDGKTYEPPLLNPEASLKIGWYF